MRFLPARTPMFSLLLMALVFDAPASASRRVAVIAPEARGGGAQRLSKAIHSKLLRLLSGDSIEAIAPTRKQAASLRRCGARTGCFKAAARPLRADFVLASRIQKKGKKLVVSLRLISAARGSVAGSTVLRERANAGGVARVATAAQQLVLAQPGPVKAAATSSVPRPAAKDLPIAAAVRAQTVDGEEPAR